MGGEQGRTGRHFLVYAVLYFSQGGGKKGGSDSTSSSEDGRTMRSLRRKLVEFAASYEAVNGGLFEHSCAGELPAVSPAVAIVPGCSL